MSHVFYFQFENEFRSDPSWQETFQADSDFLINNIEDQRDDGQQVDQDVQDEDNAAAAAGNGKPISANRRAYLITKGNQTPMLLDSPVEVLRLNEAMEFLSKYFYSLPMLSEHSQDQN